MKNMFYKSLKRLNFKNDVMYIFIFIFIKTLEKGQKVIYILFSAQVRRLVLRT